MKDIDQVVTVIFKGKDVAMLWKFPLNTSENHAVSQEGWEDSVYYTSRPSWACFPKTGLQTRWELNVIEYWMWGWAFGNSWQESTKAEIFNHLISQSKVWTTSRIFQAHSVVTEQENYVKTVPNSSLVVWFTAHDWGKGKGGPFFSFLGKKEVSYSLS